MRVYLGQTRGRGWIERLEALGFGEMTVRGEMPPRRFPWAFDNGAFRDWTAGRPFDTEAFERDLETIWRYNGRPDFIVVPDIVAGALESLAFSSAWVNHKMLRHNNCPLYLAVQDGMTPADVAPHIGPFNGVFVGGTLDWKIETGADWVRFAHGLNLPCHIGRAGTERRAAWATRIGADSIDSCLPLFSEENLARFLEDSGHDSASCRLALRNRLKEGIEG